MMDVTTRIPAFYFPTNVMLLDDDQALLNSMRGVIDKSFPYVLQDNPIQAIEYLRQHTFTTGELANQLGVRHDLADSDDFREESPVTIYTADLLKNLANANRFSRILCIVIDKVMGKVDGVQLCHRMRQDGLMVKRILLTGQAGLEKAIDAFNSREINAYIPKLAPGNNVTDLINNQIRELVWMQFLELGDSLFGGLASKISLLSDEKFITVFDQVRKELQAVEFYLYDEVGSFVFCNADGVARLLLVKQEDDFESMIDVMSDNGAPESVVESVKSYKYYPYSTTKSDILLADGVRWADLLVPMQQVSGKNVFYSIVELPKLEIFSFNEYMGKIWKPVEL